MFEHSDTLHEITRKSSLGEKLKATHRSLNKTFPFIVRIAVAIYDAETKVLKTFLHSSGADLAQGFYFSKPIPDEEFREYVIQYLAEHKKRMEISKQELLSG